MPRVLIKKKEYKASDLSKWIVVRMYELGVRQRELGELLGISQPRLSEKLKKNQFSYEDLLTVFQRLKATDEDILKIMKM